MFKIDKAGFYKNRKGERVQIVRCPESGVWKDICNNVYDIWGFYAAIRGYDTRPMDIIAHWEEPSITCENGSKINFVKEYEAADKGWNGEPLELEEFTHEADCVSKEKKQWFVVDAQVSPIPNECIFRDKLSATRKAYELAAAHKGCKFYILETIAAYTAEVEIKEIRI